MGAAVAQVPSGVVSPPRKRETCIQTPENFREGLHLIRHASPVSRNGVRGGGLSGGWPERRHTATWDLRASSKGA
jgi:hypothetical protein